MNSNYKKSILDTKDVLIQKSKAIENYIESQEELIYNEEASFLNNIVKNLSAVLPKESFSSKFGVLIYKFDHKEKDRECFISPEVYLVENNYIVYEVFEPKKYLEVSRNTILISNTKRYFCEMDFRTFLRYVSAEDICNFLEEYINKDFEEYKALEERRDFLNNNRYR